MRRFSTEKCRVFAEIFAKTLNITDNLLYGLLIT